MTALVIARPAHAEGFGWHGASFRYEAIAEVFGGKYTSDAEVTRIQEAFRSCASEFTDDDELERSVRVIGGMLRQGWHATRGRELADEQWRAFDTLQDCPKVLPEFSFSPTAEMVSPLVFQHMIDSSPHTEVMANFLKFGRAIDSTRSHERCRDAIPGYSVNFDAPLTWCSPVYLVLTPAEVQRLAVEWRDAWARLSPNERKWLTEFDSLLARAASDHRALYFIGHD